MQQHFGHAGGGLADRQEPSHVLQLRSIFWSSVFELCVLFAQRTVTVSDTDRDAPQDAWMFVVQADLLPSYVPMRIASKILFVGESVQMFETNQQNAKQQSGAYVVHMTLFGVFFGHEKLREKRTTSIQRKKSNNEMCMFFSPQNIHSNRTQKMCRFLADLPVMTDTHRQLFDMQTMHFACKQCKM